MQPEHKTVHETHTTDTPWCVRPWTLDDLLLIKPFMSQAGNTMRFGNREKTNTQLKCQDKRNVSQMKEQDKVMARDMEGTLPNSFYEASLALSPNWTKIPPKRKLQTNFPDEPGCKNSQQKVANRIQEYIQIIIHHNELDLFLGCTTNSISANQLMWYITLIKERITNHMILSIDAVKAFDKMQHPFLMKKKHSWKEG